MKIDDVRSEATLSAEDVRRIFDYEADTGLLRWRVSTGPRAVVGCVAGKTATSGHRQVCVNRRIFQLHRVVWAHVVGSWPTGQIDHVNGVRDDNRWGNIRDVPQTINAQNIRGPSQNKKSGAPLGVTRSNGRWQARIHVNGRCLQIGTFDTTEEAAAAYIHAKRQLHDGCTI